MESGVFHLEAEISWDAVASQLAIIREMDAKPDLSEITVHVSGIGGAILAASAIADALLTCTKPVRTVGSGYIASSAVLVLAAGTRGSRMVSPNAMLMLHVPRVPRPDAEMLTLRELTRFVTSMERKVAHYYAQLSLLTGQDSTFWPHRLSNGEDLFMTPEEAIGLGLADAVLTPVCRP